MGNLIINFIPTDPAAINGYLVKYRRVGDTLYTTVTPNGTASPITINGVNNTFSYEGTIQSDCGSGILSAPVSFSVEPCIGDNKKSVNGVCETGLRYNITSAPTANPDEFACTYKYVFSDGTESANFIEISSTACAPGLEGL